MCVLPVALSIQALQLSRLKRGIKRLVQPQAMALLKQLMQVQGAG